MSDFHAARLSLIEGFNGRPALIDPRDSEQLATMCMTMFTRTSMPTADERKQADIAQIESVERAYGIEFPRERAKPFLFSGGLAFIPMRGVLVHRNGDPWAGTRGYDDIRREFDAAVADPDVAGIVFDIHSGGGMVYGNFELAKHIRESREKKPSLAVVNAGAMSGAYSLGSAATRMVTTQSGDTGSIGVVTMHVDMSKALEKYGVTISMIHAGEHKVDGHPFAPLPDGVRSDMQARLDSMWSSFIGVVAENRGMSEAAVRDTQARVYQANDAVRIGLVDAVMSPQDAIASFRAEVFSTNPNDRSEAMDTNDTTTGNEGLNNADAAAAAAATTAASEKASSDERTRIEGIVSCEAAKGRESLANHFAFKTKMSVEDATAALAAAPLATAAAPTKSPLESAMDGTGGGPGVTTGNGDGGAGGEGANGADLLGAYGSATGHKVQRDNK